MSVMHFFPDLDSLITLVACNVVLTTQLGKGKHQQFIFLKIHCFCSTLADFCYAQECLTDGCTGLSSLQPTQRPEMCCGNYEFHGRQRKMVASYG
jgi:hypothetical protein